MRLCRQNPPDNPHTAHVWTGFRFNLFQTKVIFFVCIGKILFFSSKLFYFFYFYVIILLVVQKSVNKSKKTV